MNSCTSLHTKIWRKEMGVEPTQDRLAALTGFEDQPPHRGCIPSVCCHPAGLRQGKFTFAPKCIQSAAQSQTGLVYGNKTATSLAGPALIPPLVKGSSSIFRKTGLRRGLPLIKGGRLVSAANARGNFDPPGWRVSCLHPLPAIPKWCNCATNPASSSRQRRSSRSAPSAMRRASA